jgi:hypothetical protein
LCVVWFNANCVGPYVPPPGDSSIVLINDVPGGVAARSDNNEPVNAATTRQMAAHFAAQNDVASQMREAALAWYD